MAENPTKCCHPLTTSVTSIHGELNPAAHIAFIDSLVSAQKQKQRIERLSNLPPAYHGTHTESDRSILTAPIEQLVSDVQRGHVNPQEILRAYGKVTVLSHSRINAVTEVLFPESEKWLAAGDIDLTGPLAGIPVSLKDSINVEGFDTSLGYSNRANRPAEVDGLLTKLLKRAGAVPHVKTALPITLLSFESSNDLWGICKNPHNPRYSPGGSTGGESALLAVNGSRIGIGSDVAGSVRVPAAWSGIYSLRCSTGRWPKTGSETTTTGQEGVPSVFSPMARTLNDLTYFTKRLLEMQPWKTDYTVHPIAWRQDSYDHIVSSRQLRIGLLHSDGVCPPTPAIARALDTTAAALQRAGHTIVPIGVGDFPADATPLEGLCIASKLLCADGGHTFSQALATGEWNDSGAAQLQFYMRKLPRFLKYLHYLWVRYARRDTLWASIIRGFNPLTAAEQWKMVGRRDKFRARWFEWLSEPDQSFDFLLCPTHASPALPHNAMRDAVSSCGYTFLFNLLDYTAGVVPVCKVHPTQDRLSPEFKPSNAIAQGVYKYYDADKMAGLPCAVQVVGGVPERLSEEKTLACMKVVDCALRDAGVVYEQIELSNAMDGKAA